MESILSIVAIIISVLSVALTIITFQWTALRDRRQATLDAYNRLQEQALDFINKYTIPEIKDVIKNTKSDEYRKLTSCVAKIEHFCVGVNQGIYSRETVYELAHGYFEGYLKKRIEPIIDKKNWGNYDYYGNVHKVYDWMESNKREIHDKQKRRIG